MGKFQFSDNNSIDLYLIKDDLLNRLITSKKKIIWIWGESGSGKSVLASLAFTRLKEQEKLWLDIDENDTGIEFFLQRLNEQLVRFTDQTLTQTSTPKDQYQQLVQSIKRPVHIFLDNAQWIDAFLPAFCNWTADLTSNPIKLFVVSQNGLTGDYLSLFNKDEIEEVPPALLHFTFTESITLYKQHGQAIDNELIQIHKEYNGLPIAISSSLLASKDNKLSVTASAFLRAARWEEEAGNTLPALALYVKAKNFDHFAKLFLGNARHWFASGQREKIGDVLKLVSVKEKNQYPWCWVWESLLELPTQPDLARKQAEHAFQLFKKTDDMQGMYLSISHAVLTYLVKLSTFNSIRSLLQELSQFDSDENYQALDSHAKASVSYVIYFCMFVVMPENKAVQKWEERTLSALMSETEIVPRLKMQVLVQKAYLYRGDNYKIHPLETLVAIGNDTPVQPYDIMNYNMAKIQEGWCLGRFDEIKKLYQQSKELTAANNMQANIAHTSLQVVISLLLNHEYDEAKKEIYTLLDAIPREMTALLHHLYALEAWRQSLLKEHTQAMSTAKQCTTISNESGCIAYIGFSYVVETYAYTLAGEFEQARNKLFELEQQPHLELYHIFDFHKAMLNSYLAFEAKEPTAATEQAIKAIEFAAKKNLFYFIWSVPEVVSLNVSLALEANCQLDFCHKIIEMRALPVPAHAKSENSWHWPIRVKTLGGFHTNIEALNKSGKSRRIQLLIMYLAIVYGETGVPLDIVYDTLWPDEDAPSARHKLDNTLYRLRQSLGKHNLAIINNNLRLDTRGIWVDVFYLLNLIKQCKKALQTGSNLKLINSNILKIINLYQGEFLDGVLESSHEIANFRVYICNQVSSVLKTTYRCLDEIENKATLEAIQSHLIFIEKSLEVEEIRV